MQVATRLTGKPYMVVRYVLGAAYDTAELGAKMLPRCMVRSHQAVQTWLQQLKASNKGKA